ncbi:hypothetical protein B0O80DRAFT_498746 [Mortierella sp. GBAus27b]|nr:hypothetical protein BGX31_002692 [Mortierella sp. GBA43]KAI8353906.1 hypothetical protein B0O80DRAFT_498746 [Mortierella sp. GBAus27b]
MDESVGNDVNGVHVTPTDGHLKRKSHPSPIGDSPGSPIIGAEAKRPKTSDFSETSPTRKNTEVTQVEFNEVLGTIFHVVHNLDKYEVMDAVAVSMVNGEKSESSVQAIQARLADAQYSSIVAFKDDIGNIIKQAIIVSSQDPVKQEYAQRLLQLANDLITDKSHYTIRSHGKKVRSREETQASATPERDFEKIALIQRTADGFVFTSKAIVKDDSLDQELSKTIVIPTASSANPPLLKDINTKPRPASSAADQTKKNTGVEYCTYVPFGSFAPFIDSSNAEMDAEDTSTAYDFLMGRFAQKTRSHPGNTEEYRKARDQLDGIMEMAQQYHTQESSAELKEDDLMFLADDGLDVKALLQLAQSAQANDFHSPEVAIQKNAILLSELYKMQEERFAAKDQTISARERELAEALQQSLVDLASQATPSTFVTPDAVEDAMRRIPYKETSFTGTLPPNKPFAFPANTTRSGLPQNATGYPIHNPVAHRKSVPPTTIIPQVALSPHLNMTGGYPSIPQPMYQAYSIPQQPTHQKTYSRPRVNASSAPTPLQVSANGNLTFRKNFHTIVTSAGGTPPHWRRNDSQTPCANCGTLVSPIWRLGIRNNEKLCNACGQFDKKWNGLHRPVAFRQ